MLISEYRFEMTKLFGMRICLATKNTMLYFSVPDFSKIKWPVGTGHFIIVEHFGYRRDAIRNAIIQFSAFLSAA